MKQHTSPPSQTFPTLFKKVHELRLFPDAKTMSDIIPKESTQTINEAFVNLEKKDAENVQSFLERYFHIPKQSESNFKTDSHHSLFEHVESLWKVLRREKDTFLEGSSLVPLPLSLIHI